MKYAALALAAGVLFACNEGPDNDTMEERSDRQERKYDTPEMSGEYNEMRQPIEEVHPRVDALPIDGEIRNDSLIVPDDAMTRSGRDADRTNTPRDGAPVTNPGGTTSTPGFGTDDTTENTMRPLMPEGDSPHHSGDQIKDDAVIQGGHTPETDTIEHP